MKPSPPRDPQKALAAYVRAENWEKAARIATDLGDEEKMVRYSLLAALGRIPPGLDRATPLRAAQHLATAGRHAAALPLFEHAQDFGSAARAARTVRQHDQAARLFERAGEWMEAAESYQALGRMAEALRALDQGERSLEARGDDGGLGLELKLRRAELLLQIGNKASAASLLRSLPPSVRRAELLEKAGLVREAVQGYLEAGATGKAHSLTDRAPDRERLLADVHLQNGRPVDAGHIYAKLGLAREAAEAYEAGGEWGYAAYRWEAAQQPKRAAQAYERAGQLANAARCFATAGLTSDAVHAYVRDGNIAAAADLQVRAGQLLEAASLYLSKGEKAKAASILMRIQERDSSFGLGAILLAPLLIEEGFAADALERLRRISARSAGIDGEAFLLEQDYWQGRALEALGRGSEAQERYERVVQSNDSHRDARERLAQLRPAATRVAPAPSVTAPAGEGEILAVGRRVGGRYDILAEVGRGGMGRVFKAHDLELDETVAIKALVDVGTGGFGEEARLLQELQICRRISHPNVVRVFDLGRVSTGIFLTMEYLEGLRLDQVILAEAPMRFGRVRDLIAELAAGLREAHSLGIVHRDLKPSNVMVTPTRLKILDFGIAATMTGARARLTQEGFAVGSPMYMSPDQILGRQLDGRSDLYSLGLLAFCMIAGKEPYEGLESHALLRKKVREPPPDVRALRPETPEPWVALLEKLMARKPEDRFQSAQEVLDALEGLPGD